MRRSLTSPWHDRVHVGGQLFNYGDKECRSGREADVKALGGGFCLQKKLDTCRWVRLVLKQVNPRAKKMGSHRKGTRVGASELKKAHDARERGRE